MKDTNDLALRLVQHPRWEWQAGMRLESGPGGLRGRVLEGGADYVIWYGEGSTREGGGIQEACPPRDDMIPDLDDPATVGVLLSWLPRHGVWRPYGWGGAWVCAERGEGLRADVDGRDTRAEAVAAALLVAWGAE